jgi:hypothetical protein
MHLSSGRWDSGNVSTAHVAQGILPGDWAGDATAVEIVENLHLEA